MQSSRFNGRNNRASRQLKEKKSRIKQYTLKIKHVKDETRSQRYVPCWEKSGGGIKEKVISIVSCKYQKFKNRSKKKQFSKKSFVYSYNTLKS